MLNRHFLIYSTVYLFAIQMLTTFYAISSPSTPLYGVGFVLAVHEGPQSISKRYINEPLKLGMLTSNESGLYIENKHGIRIESLIVSISFLKTAHGEFYQFKTITLCPIDTRPIVSALLTKEEKEWLNDYHQEVFARLSPYLDRVHKAFLREKTKKIK